MGEEERGRQEGGKRERYGIFRSFRSSLGACGPFGAQGNVQKNTHTHTHTHTHNTPARPQ